MYQVIYFFFSHKSRRLLLKCELYLVSKLWEHFLCSLWVQVLCVQQQAVHVEENTFHRIESHFWKTGNTEIVDPEQVESEVILPESIFQNLNLKWAKFVVDYMHTDLP